MFKNAWCSSRESELYFVPRYDIERMITVSNYNCREPNALFWTPWASAFMFTTCHTSWKLTPLPNFHWTSKVICVPFLLVLWQFCTMSFDPTPYKSSPCHPTQLISCYLFMFYTLSTTGASYIFMHVWPSGGMWLTYQGYNLQEQWLSPSSYWLPIDPRLAVGFHAHLSISNPEGHGVLLVIWFGNCWKKKY